MKVILGSKSLPRKKIMDVLKIDYEQISPELDESPYKEKYSDPKELCVKLAEAKAEALKKKINYPALIISCDSVPICNNKGYGKPRDFDHAFKILKEIIGKIHYIYSGMCIVNTENNKKWSFLSNFAVELNNQTDDEIKKHLENNEHFLRQACAYDFHHRYIVKQILGNFVGQGLLPMDYLIPILEEHGIKCNKNLPENTVFYK